MLRSITTFSFAPTVAGNYSTILNNNGCIDTSECYFIQPTGINNISALGISIFPNPVNDHLQVGWNGAQAEIIIRNMMGRVLLHTSIAGSSASIDTKNYPSGLYTIAIQVNGELETRTIIVTR